MKPFTLNTVLNYRQQLEDIAKNKLAEARLRERKIRVRREEQQQKYTSVISTIDKKQLVGIDINELIRLEEHLIFIKNTINELNVQIAEREKEVAACQNELLKKSRDRQIMEKLKEQQNTAWKQYLNKKEAAMLDEIAIIFHNK